MVRTITPTMTDAAPIAKGDQQDTWIESPLYDSMFFIAAPILGALYLFASLRAPHLRIIPGVFFTVGMAHYLSTFSFYFGDDNRANYRSNILAFFLGPAALLVAAGIMRLSPLLPLLLTIIYLWNVWHISLQSCGILSVYRHLSSAPHDEKKYANGLILSVSAALVAANINGFEPLRQFLVRLSPQVPILIFYASLAAVVIAGGIYIHRIFYRSRIGMPIRGAEAMFLGSSVVLFHPFAWASNAADATNGVLFGHFVQYIALVWLLHRRKYLPGTGSALQNGLASLSRNVILLGALMFTLAVAFYMIGKMTQVYGIYGVYAWLFNALVLIHFYLDGWIWAFKRPFVRQSLGPYLSRRPIRVSNAAPIGVNALPAR
ncbi:MAG TPA: hypothetical protein VKL19_12820 [Thermoanaerobaculia bacterium]|nr:hypothetical protein [Thermoanaerobaculia bacterium]